MTATVLLWAVVVIVLLEGALAVLALHRLGDLLEAVNHAIERVAVEFKRRNDQRR